MKLKQISVPIENSRGRLYDLIKSLAERGITPKAMTLVDTGDYGELRILVSAVATVRQILIEIQMPGRIDEVVALEIENWPGYLPRIIEALMDAGVHIKYSYAYVEKSSEKNMMIFCFSNNDKALQVLSKKQTRTSNDRALKTVEKAA